MEWFRPRSPTRLRGDRLAVWPRLVASRLGPSPWVGIGPVTAYQASTPVRAAGRLPGALGRAGQPPVGGDGVTLGDRTVQGVLVTWSACYCRAGDHSVPRWVKLRAKEYVMSATLMRERREIQSPSEIWVTASPAPTPATVSPPPTATPLGSPPAAESGAPVNTVAWAAHERLAARYEARPVRKDRSGGLPGEINPL